VNNPGKLFEIEETWNLFITDRKNWELSLMGRADWDDQPGTFGINGLLGYARGHNHPHT
jgi:hypothetical protein